MHEGHPPPILLPMQPPPIPTHPPVPRLRSVKIEQGKLNDQANTLADLAKVSKVGLGGMAPWASLGWLGLQGERGTFSKGQGAAPAEVGTALAFLGQVGDTDRDTGQAGQATRGHRPCLQVSIVTRGSDCERDSGNLHQCVKASFNIGSSFVFKKLVSKKITLKRIYN